MSAREPRFRRQKSQDGLAASRFAFEEAERLGADPTAIAVAATVRVETSRQSSRRSHAMNWPLLAFPTADRPGHGLVATSWLLPPVGMSFFLTQAQMTWYRADYLGGDAEAARDPRASPLLAHDLGGVVAPMSS